MKFAFLAAVIIAVALWLFSQNAPRDTPAPTPRGPTQVEIEAPNPFGG